MKKILYLSYDGLTDPLGQSQILPYLSGLAKSGFHITIVSFEKHRAFDAEEEKIKSMMSERLSWIPLRYHKTPPVLSTLWDIFLLWRCATRVHGQTGFDIVHCRSYITSLVGQKMKRKWGIKFLFDMRGFWVDERVEGGLWNLNNLLYKSVYKFFKKKEKEFLTDADRIVSLTENAKTEIRSWGVPSEKITVVPTCVDLELFDPSKIRKQDQTKLRDELGIQATSFVLLYLGSWGTWYLTNEMLSFFSTLKQIKPDSKLLVVTPNVVNLDGYKYRNDVIVTRSARESVPLMISISNASVFFIKPSFSKKASSATKMAEIMAMGIPMVTNAAWGDVEEIIDKSECGILLRSFDEDEKKLAVHALDSLVSEQRANVVSEFSLTRGIEAYTGIYAALMRGNVKQK